jgi:hypothetical protein
VIEMSVYTPFQSLANSGRTGEVRLVNALQIRDTNPHAGSPVDVSMYPGRKVLHISNTHNQTVSVTVTAYNANGGAGVSTASFSVTAGATAILTAAGTLTGGTFTAGSNFSLLGEPLQQISISATASTAPTSGQLDVWVEGRVNG